MIVLFSSTTYLLEDRRRTIEKIKNEDKVIRGIIGTVERDE